MRKAIAAVMLLGCPSDNNSGPVSIDDLFPQLVDAFCTEAANCGTEPDKATCLADRNDHEMATLTLIADVHAGTIGYDAAVAGDCIAKIRHPACTSLAPRADIEDAFPPFCIFDILTRTG